MTKKRTLLAIFGAVCVCVLSCAFVLTGCGNKHKFGSEWSSDSEYHWHQCTKHDDDADDVEDKAKHEWSDWEGPEATCAEAANRSRYCTVCGYTETDTTAALGHDYVLDTESEDYVAATCEEGGTDVYKCSRCGDTYTEKTDALGHNYSVTFEWTDTDGVVTATATYVCANDETDTDTVDATVTGPVEGVYTATYVIDGKTFTDTYTGTTSGETQTSYTVAVTAADGATSVTVGETLALSATVVDQDNNAASGTIVWSTTDTAITVDPSTGVVTGVTEATSVTVTATFTDANGISATGTITIAVVAAASTEPQTSYTVTVSAADGATSVTVGETLALSATVVDQDNNAASGTIVWSTTDTAISVDPSTGVVTGVTAAGSVTITATFTDANGVSATGTITIAVVAAPVVYAVTVDDIDETTGLTVVYGDTSNPTGFTATVTADGETCTEEYTLTWTSSDETVATFDENGILSVVKVGTTKITVTCTFTDATIGPVTSSFTLTVAQNLVEISTVGQDTKDVTGWSGENYLGNTEITYTVETADDGNQVYVLTGTANGLTSAQLTDFPGASLGDAYVVVNIYVPYGSTLYYGWNGTDYTKSGANTEEEGPWGTLIVRVSVGGTTQYKIVDSNNAETTFYISFEGIEDDITIEIDNQNIELVAVDGTAGGTSENGSAEITVVVMKNGVDITDNVTLTWTSTDNNVATVEAGTVTAVAEGSATVTVTYTYGEGKSVSASVIVQVVSDELYKDASTRVANPDQYRSYTPTESEGWYGGQTYSNTEYLAYSFDHVDDSGVIYIKATGTVNFMDADQATEFDSENGKAHTPYVIICILVHPGETLYTEKYSDGITYPDTEEDNDYMAIILDITNQYYKFSIETTDESDEPIKTNYVVDFGEIVRVQDHIWGDTPTATTQADCENAGTATYTCSVCGETNVVETNPATGHDYDVTFTWSQDTATGTWSATATVTCEKSNCPKESAGFVENTDYTVECEMDSDTGYYIATVTIDGEEPYTSYKYPPEAIFDFGQTGFFVEDSATFANNSDVEAEYTVGDDGSFTITLSGTASVMEVTQAEEFGGTAFCGSYYIVVGIKIYGDETISYMDKTITKDSTGHVRKINGTLYNIIVIELVNFTDVVFTVTFEDGTEVKYTLVTSGLEKPVIIVASEERDVSSDTNGTVTPFVNESDVEITAGTKDNTYVVTGTASVMDASQAGWYNTKDCEAGDYYIVLYVVANGATVSFGGKTYENVSDGVYVIVRVAGKDDGAVTKTSTTFTVGSVSYTVTYSVELPGNDDGDEGGERESGTYVWGLGSFSDTLATEEAPGAVTDYYLHADGTASTTYVEGDILSFVTDKVIEYDSSRGPFTYGENSFSGGMKTGGGSDATHGYYFKVDLSGFEVGTEITLTVVYTANKSESITCSIITDTANVEGSEVANSAEDGTTSSSTSTEGTVTVKYTVTGDTDALYIWFSGTARVYGVILSY